MVKLFVEGGGNDKSGIIACQKGFSKFLEKAGLKGKMPRIVARGSRRSAYESFCTAIANGEDALLLVDSEDPVQATSQSGDNPEHWNPWLHLKNRQGDGWDKPKGAENTDCHLMVQCMESWFHADRTSLQKFYGQGFRANALLPEGSRVESLDKDRVIDAIRKATKDCKTKGEYDKGKPSFELLAYISPQQVMEASPWAHRFVTAVKKKMDSAHAA